MKILLKILKWLLFSILGLLLLVFLLLLLDRDAKSIELSGEEKAAIDAKKEYDPQVDSSRYYELLQAYGNNKTLPEGYEWQCLLALSHYPELKETRIDFRIEPAFLPLASRPEPFSVLFPWVKRKYLVIISNASTDFFEPILLQNTPFNEQVGVIGHELGHTVFYQDKHSLQLAGIAYCYTNVNGYRVEFERATDKRAIAHGLGYQLYDFAFFVRKAFGDSQKEIAEEEGGMYLSPKEIASEMKKYDFYRDTLDPVEAYFDE